MGDIGFPVGADQVPIPINLHGTGSRTGNNQISPLSPGEIPLLVDTETDEVAIEQEHIPTRSIIVCSQDLPFEHQVGKPGLNGVAIGGEPLLNLEDPGNDIE